MDKHFLAPVLTMLACLGLTACMTVGPDYTAPTMDLPANWNNRSLSAAYATEKETSGDLTHWWKNLDDPLLSSLIAEALASSPDLRSAQARLREERYSPPMNKSNLPS